jgi:maltose O-acetyltransferase
MDPTATISLSSRVVTGSSVFSRRRSIVVGEKTLIAFKTLLVACRPDGSVAPIRIGARCFVGGGAAIMPGVTIGDECVIGAGAVVTEDVPSRCVAAGVPARVIERGINVGDYGRFDYADWVEYQLTGKVGPGKGRPFDPESAPRPPKPLNLPLRD